MIKNLFIYKMSSTGRFLSLLMHSRTQAHVYHLDTNSYALHKALETYYTSIVPLIDKYAETYKGKYGKINRMTPMLKIDRNPSNVLPYLTKLLKTISALKLSRNPTLTNIYEEISSLILTTIYKVRNLK
jgi:hypothetical protein